MIRYASNIAIFDTIRCIVPTLMFISFIVHCGSPVVIECHTVIDRDCWPVTDKKDEQLFRKKCVSWLEQIVQVSTNKNFIETTKKFFTFDVLTSIRVLHQKKLVQYSYYYYYNHLTAFSRTTWVSRYQKGKTNLDFTGARNSERQWHQLGHMQVCTSLQTDNHASTHHSVFYRPYAIPAAQPTASKH